MDKLRLDYFFKVGGKLADGDVFISTLGRRVVVGKNISDTSANRVDQNDGRRSIASLAPRESNGAIPCEPYLPVIGVHSAGECHHLACDIVWLKSAGSRAIKTWTPDINYLIKMQAEHDATLSKAETVEPKLTTEAKEDLLISPCSNFSSDNGGVSWSPLLSSGNGACVELDSDMSVKQKVYTQEMADNGELPEAGMECLVLNETLHNPKFELCKVLFVGEFNCIYTSDSCKERVASITDGNLTFKPIAMDSALCDIENMIHNCDTPKDAAREIYNKYIGE